MKRLVIGVAVAAASVALAIFIGLFVIVNFVQKQHISNLDNDIATGVAEIEAIPEIDKVLTIQSQLNTITPLHEEKPASSRMIDYLKQLTPAQATISQASLNFEEQKMTLDGNADSLETVNKFVDTLKFTTYTVKGSDQEAQNAFSEVVLAGFGVSDGNASYQIEFKFNPEIYDNTKAVTLDIPNIISTRSQTEKPTDLFQQIEPTEEDTL
jgi:hypothetical protein